MKNLVDMLAVLGLTLHLLLVSGRQTTVKDGRPLALGRMSRPR
jgi:hypothetical protein